MRQDVQSPGLPRGALAYVAAVTAAAAGVLAAFLPRLSLEPRSLILFAALAVGAAAGSVLIVSTERNHGFNTALVFVAGGVVLLPPELVALVAVAQYCPRLLTRRYPWYSQLFNVANYALDAVAAWAAAHVVAGAVHGHAELGHAAGAVAACVVLVAVNHGLLAGALRLARGVPLRASGLFAWKSVSTDLLLASLGVTLAEIFRSDPYLVPVGVAPFVLVSRSFRVVELLQRSERRFRAIYESTAMGIRLTDSSGGILDHNAAFAAMVGHEGDDLTGRSVDEFAVPGDGDPDATALREELVAGRRDSYAREERFRRADGVEGWGHLTASLVRDADGNPDFSIGMVHDVSDRKVLEERLYQAEKLDAVGRLAGGVAHDFNNLLTIITAHSHFLLAGLEPGDDTRREDVEAIAQAAERAASLTKQLLAFGRKQVLQPRVVDVNAIVAETNRMLSRTLGRHVRVVTELDPELGRVKADPGQVEQVLVNLALNARDAMPDGGTLTISTANGERETGPDSLPAPCVIVSVADTGCGMDAATRGKVFEPFFTTKGAKGTGLGLASVYGIVAQSGGTIDVTSAPGEGTTMAVSLPRIVEQVEVPAPPVAALRAA